MAGELREDEVEMLRSMFGEDELAFPGYPEELFTFTLSILVDAPEGDPGAQVALELSCTLPDGYPQESTACVSVSCDRIRREQNDRLVEALNAALGELGPDEMQFLFAMEWVREHAAEYFGQAAAPSKKLTPAAAVGPKPVKGFMREWCSFVSLYKDSYISGPNRFEVMMSLACSRGLNITGMGISGKPGGLVAEGEENDLVEFMGLMRTEFFETLNPRGRKLTTRLQERWPLDAENDRYEAAVIIDRLRNDAYRSADRERTDTKFKPGEKERLEKQEAEDRARLDAWRAANKGRAMGDEEVEQLVAAGPPGGSYKCGNYIPCSAKGVYSKCGPEEPPTLEEVNAQRIFKDFTIFQGKEGFEAAYQDAAKIFKDMGRMDGFDSMFAYRFS